MRKILTEKGALTGLEVSSNQSGEKGPLIGRYREGRWTTHDADLYKTRKVHQITHNFLTPTNSQRPGETNKICLPPRL